MFRGVRQMIIYEVSLHDTSSPNFYTIYFSNKRKADSFKSKYKKEFNNITIEKCVVKNNKRDIIKFLNTYSETAYYGLTQGYKDE
jgi:hypothetical protein